ncbi:phosphopantetheine-binding protein [Streptomyces sp. PmtG]
MDGAPRAAHPREGHGGGRRPKTLAEASLMDIWARVLGREVGRHEDFFTIGGHSLLVMRVLSEVRERHGVRLPVSVMFDHRTVQELAGRLGQDLGPAVLVQSAGDGPPVFFLARAEDGLLARHGLARRLSGRAPVYAVVAERGADGAAAVRHVQPHGPYHLLDTGDGLSEEVARALADDGDEVLSHGPDSTDATDATDSTGSTGEAALADALFAALPAAPEEPPGAVPPAPRAAAARAGLLPDRPAPAEPTGATTMRPYRLAPDVTALLRRPADQAGVPVAGVLASVAALLSRLTGERQVTLGLPPGRCGPLPGGDHRHG